MKSLARVSQVVNRKAIVRPGCAAPESVAPLCCLSQVFQYLYNHIPSTPCT